MTAGEAIPRNSPRHRGGPLWSQSIAGGILPDGADDTATLYSS